MDGYPTRFQPLAVVTPLWHGVDLCRTLALGTADAAGVLIHEKGRVLLAPFGAVPRSVALELDEEAGRLAAFHSAWRYLARDSL